MLSLMGHQSTVMLLSLLIIHPCKAVYESFPFPGRLHRTQDPGCYPTLCTCLGELRGATTPPPRAGSPRMIRPHLQWGWGRSCLQAPPRSWPKGLTPPGSSKPRSGHRTSPPQGQKGPLIPLFHRARRARNLRARGRWLFISGRHPPAKWVVAGVWHHISRSNSRVL